MNKIKSLITIVDSQHSCELYSAKLRLEQTASFELLINEESALEQLELWEPDLIFISDGLTILDRFDLCKKIRQTSFISRPVIIFVSHYPDTPENKIEAFNSGADDYLDFFISSEEFTIRIMAHLRRHIEELSNQNTKLPGINLVNTFLKRAINFNEQFAFMLLSLNNFEVYIDSYGHLAGNQLFKAFIAVIKSVLKEDDFLGHINNSDFAIITDPIKSEFIAKSICKTFDLIIPKFYPAFEANRGYTIITDEEKTSIKVPLVSISIGITSNVHNPLNNYQTVFTMASSMRDLAKHQIGSGWLIDRPLIERNEKTYETKPRPYVLVIESDAALAYLLTTTLEMEGFISDATSSKNEAIKLIDEFKPDVILIDAVMQDDDGWSICNYIRKKQELFNSKIIMATVLSDKEKAFKNGADLYIQKPYELIAIHKWIHKFIKDIYY